MLRYTQDTTIFNRDSLPTIYRLLQPVLANFVYYLGQPNDIECYEDLFSLIKILLVAYYKFPINEFTACILSRELASLQPMIFLE